MQTVKIKQGVREELEVVLPIDRIIDIDDNFYVALQDTEFVVLEEEIDG